MALLLEIEHLLGVAYAAQGPDTAAPDWPPQPDRVFSALVAAWAARGERADERAALEWLERQPAPLVAASAAAVRPAPTSFVPPNDKLQPTANPAWRTRQPRRFPAALPKDPTVRLVWPDAERPPVASLDAVARDVAYVGHSASLTRCRFTEAQAPDGAQPARRAVYQGRLRELEIAYSKDDPRRRRRPTPGESVQRPHLAPELSRNAFSSDWLVFEIESGAIDLRAAPLACKALIKAVMSGYGEAGLAPPEWVCGHRADGSPSPDPHLAAAPLAFAGFGHADGSLMGLALVPPRERGDLLVDPDFAAALLRLATSVAEDGRRALRLTLGEHGALELALTSGSGRASLNPARYTGSSCRWASVTPLVLDRHLDPPNPAKSGDNDRYRHDAEALIKAACVNIGLDEPVRAIATKHAAVTGAPSAYPSGHAPRWTRWRTPPALASRRLSHAILQFERPQSGPVLIGAGRFAGLGLCLPLDGDPVR